MFVACFFYIRSAATAFDLFTLSTVALLDITECKGISLIRVVLDSILSHQFVRTSVIFNIAIMCYVYCFKLIFYNERAWTARAYLPRG